MHAMRMPAIHQHVGDEQCVTKRVFAHVLRVQQPCSNKTMTSRIHWFGWVCHLLICAAPFGGRGEMRSTRAPMAVQKRRSLMLDFCFWTTTLETNAFKLVQSIAPEIDLTDFEILACTKMARVRLHSADGN